MSLRRSSSSLNQKGARRGRNSRKVVPNLTPLIDVIFLLIVFFMSATTFRHLDHIPIEFSRLSSSVDNMPLRIVMVAEDTIKWRDQSYLVAELADVLKQIDDLGDKSAVIVTPRRMDLQSVMRVVDEVRLAGIDRFTIHDQTD